MSDYIYFLNWPRKRVSHPWDKLSLEEKYAEYIKLKASCSRISDEDLSLEIGKGAHYFAYLKSQMRKREGKEVKA